jgi:DNA repair exonuclease SbcCD ATPase subunit
MALAANYENRLAACTAYLKTVREDLNRQAARRDLTLETISEREAEVASLSVAVENFNEVRILFERLTEDKREVIRTKIEALVTHGIQSVFGPEIYFKIEQRIARNQVTFEYKIVHEYGGEKRESDLRGYHGGGLVALVGFLLRVVMVLFSHPARRRVIFLDESMAALDGDKRTAFAALLRTLGEQLGMQFVLITHSPEYASDADKVYEVLPDLNGRAKIVPVG